MSQANYGQDAIEPSRLLAGAAKVIAKAHFCWLATATESGHGHQRPMGRMNDVDEREWIIRFLTDGRSRKAADIRRDSEVAVIVQNDVDDAFVRLIGKAVLRERASEIPELWKDAYDAFFAGGQDRANAIFVDTHVERMELWIRGVTPEPFGMRTTILERDAEGGWRVHFR
jgi:general stress protein 26